MALSYGQIRDWKFSDAGKLADAMVDALAILREIEDALKDAGAWKSWTDSAGADGASAALSGIADYVTDRAAGAEKARDVAADTERQLEALNRTVDDVEHYAGSKGFAISDSGAVSDVSGMAGLNDAEVAERKLVQRNIEQTVADIIRDGRAIEDQAAAGLESIDHGTAPDGGAQSVDDAVNAIDTVGPIPGDGSDAYANRLWWNSLTEEQQKTLMETAADEIRQLDGLPTAVRDELNRAALDDDIAEARRELGAAQREYDEAKDNRSGSYSGIANVQGISPIQAARLAKAKEKLGELEKLQSAVDTPHSYLLEYDDSQDQLEAAVAIGNPDTASQVSVTVPGYGTTVARSVEGMTGEAKKLREDAAMMSGQPIETVSTIAYIGYQAPQDVTDGDLSVATPQRALDGGRELADFVDGISAASENEALELSVFGHSYGSTTASAGLQYLAEDGNTPVDNFVVYGSPGMTEVNPEPLEFSEASIAADGVNPRPHSNPDVLGVPRENLYYMENPGDPVSGIAGAIGQGTTLGLGNDPEHWEMNKLSTETVPADHQLGSTEPTYSVKDLNEQLRSENPDHKDIGAHSAFPHERTTSQHNLAAILAGMPEYAHHG